MRRILTLALLMVAAGCMAQPGKTYTSLQGVKDPMQVYHLRLSLKRLHQVPEAIREMKNLQTLDLSKNFIDSLPTWIGELEHLKELDMGRNWLHYLPEEIGQLTALEELDMSRNPLQELPVGIGNLASLKRLVLWSTGIVEFPPSIVALDGTLKYLDMRACALNREDQELIEDLIPNVKKVWDQACNCTH